MIDPDRPHVIVIHDRMRIVFHELSEVIVDGTGVEELYCSPEMSVSDIVIPVAVHQLLP